MTDVVVVGSYVQDLAFNTQVFPAPGETRIGTFRTGPGGKGFNQAVACNRQGISTLFIGAVGDDIFGRGVLDFANGENLRTELQVCADEPTSAASIVVNEQAENLIVVALGANNLLSTDHIEKFSSDIAAAKYLVCQIENNPAATLRAMEIAKNNGTVAVLNPAPINLELSQEILSLADIIVPNETEFSFLMQHLYSQVIDEDYWNGEDDEIHRHCLQCGVANVVLTVGEKGCFVSHNPDVPGTLGKGYYWVPAIEVTPQDTTGAGDAFNGGLAAGMVRFPGDFRKAVSYANTVAGLSTTKPGTAPAMPSRGEVKDRFGE